MTTPTPHHPWPTHPVSPPLHTLPEIDAEDREQNSRASVLPQTFRGLRFKGRQESARRSGSQLQKLRQPIPVGRSVNTTSMGFDQM
ncbi:hypothetical protein BaRGS_00015218 [Batillaria attramentaria]|uniref:Uncharacterized protein n=1 Tax=Batillaria attramentaria TaxID=370345 RepID=A0ABD0L298_9CAEN